MTYTDQKQEKLKVELVRQFGKKDANHFILAPRKYKHHFDNQTMAAYNAIIGK